MAQDVNLEKELSQIDQPEKARQIWKEYIDITTETLKLQRQNNIKAIEPLVHKALNLLSQLPNIVTDPIEKSIIENDLIPLAKMLASSAKHGYLSFSELFNYFTAKNFGLKQILAEKNINDILHTSFYK